MRVARRLLCVTAAPSPPYPSADTASRLAASESADKPRQCFSTLRIQPWQTCCLGSSAEKLLPKTLLYYGTQLGPRPLIILDHTTSGSEEAAAAAAKKYELLLSKLSWEYGAVYIPLQVEYKDPPEDLLGYSSRQICAVLDVLDVRWTHFLTHSYGCLVAARMITSEDFPHRIGTLTSLDTPLVTCELLRNMEQREVISKAERDVNVPEVDLAFAKQSLLSSLEGPLPCPAEADSELYHRYLFHPESIFSVGGLRRHEERYVPVKHLADIRHPMQFILPADNAVTDVVSHKEFFGLRRPVVLKGCQRHEDLFLDGAAKDVAAALDIWMRRFEPDAYIAKRYEQAAKEMNQLMSSTQTTTTATQSSSVEGAEQRKKKKEKKKKA